MVVICAVPVDAATPDFPLPATPSSAHDAPLTSYRLPIGPFADGTVPVRRVEGHMIRRVWKLDAPGEGTLALYEPLRAAVAKAGYRVIFDCAAQGCGGFDFRYGTDVLPEPEMHVDLGDYRFLSAESPTDGVLSLLVSRSATMAYVQLTEVLPAEAVIADPVPPPPDPIPVTSDPGAILRRDGAVTIDGLDFASGSSDLSAGRYAALEALAAWLSANPTRTVVLVGHTDMSGSMEGNLALSARRARSVRARMIETWGIAPGRIDAKGVGPLAPRATNLTEAGRMLNRRVEAVLTPDQ